LVGPARDPRWEQLVTPADQNEPHKGRKARTHLEEMGQAPDVSPEEEPPSERGRREEEWAGDHGPGTRDMSPALGKRGEPGSWKRARDGASVALAGPDFADAQWSYLFKARDTIYAAPPADPALISQANRRMRSTPVANLNGPFIKGPVWTWEIPLYFWVGGVASGSAFVALACDVAGDSRSARIARQVALGAVLPAPLLLIADLGRPERFLNMLRIFKPRSPMNMGAWCLMMFSAAASGAVAGDLLHRRRWASGLGAATALLGGYLGSYTGVLLAATAVPLWARSRLFLGPIFMATATASGAAMTRLVLVARGLPEGHPTRSALRMLETTAILSELLLSSVNERRLELVSRPLRRGTSGRLLRVAESAVLLGLAAQMAARHRSRRFEDLASLLFLGGGLAYRYAWVEAGKASAGDHAAVAAVARGRLSLEDELEVGGDPRAESVQRPAGAAVPGQRLWGEAVRRISLAVERRLRRS
jgi:hypothetical protein